jgi:hypothetical protein
MRLLLALLPALVGLASPVRAEDFSLTIKDHRFEPTELEVPAGKDLTLKSPIAMPRPKSSRATTSMPRR